MNVIFTCGGTGGHINPAIAVANILKERHPDCNILFIGAEGHMEEQLVPQAGYELVCLPGSGLSRGKSLAALKKNIRAARCVRSARPRPRSPTTAATPAFQRSMPGISWAFPPAFTRATPPPA